MSLPLKLSFVLIASLLIVAGNFRFLFTLGEHHDHDDTPIRAKSAQLERVSIKTTCDNATFLKGLIAQRKNYVKRFTPLPRENQTHWPTFFKERIKLFQLSKRQNYINPRSGCRLARWVVRSPSNENHAVIDCHMRHDQQVFNVTSKFTEKDTIYVPLNALQKFVKESLPQLKVDIVVITGQWQTVSVPNWNTTFELLIDNPHILHVFVMHKPMYAPVPSHKITSWPLGLNFRQVLDFHKEFTRRSSPKSEFIFFSKLGPTAEWRSELPSGPRLTPAKYYKTLHSSRFILAPSGRRPDSYRMYEAIGLGAKPMTNLDPDTFEHFQEELESIVLGVERWNPNDLACYAQTSSPSKVANQRMVFDEYWMEYVERRVGSPLTWWDNKRNRVASLQDIASTIS